MNSQCRIRMATASVRSVAVRAGTAVSSASAALPPFAVRAAISVAAIAFGLTPTGCATLNRAKVDATWFAEVHSERVIGATTVSADSDRIVGEYPYDLEELVTLAGTEAGFVFAELDRSVPDTTAGGSLGSEQHPVGGEIPAHVSNTDPDAAVYRPPLEVDVDIRERSYTHGISQLQAMVARVRLSSLGSTAEEPPLAIAVYRADSTESIISYFHVHDVLVEIFKALTEGRPDSAVHREASG